MKKCLNKIKYFIVDNKKPIRYSFILIGFVAVLIFIFVLTVNVNIVSKTEDNVYTVENLTRINFDYDCILILGAGIRKDGTPTPMLRDRLLAGIEAHKIDKTVPILISGDSENPEYRETDTMKQFLLELDVEEDKIICDGYGLSTYESVWRAKNIYGYKRILIVTQKYHLHRALYIADKMNIDADGLDAALETYGKQAQYNFREYFARIKDVIYSDMSPEAKYKDMWVEKYE